MFKKLLLSILVSFSLINNSFAIEVMLPEANSNRSSSVELNNIKPNFQKDAVLDVLNNIFKKSLSKRFTERNSFNGNFDMSPDNYDITFEKNIIPTKLVLWAVLNVSYGYDNDLYFDDSNNAVFPDDESFQKLLNVVYAKNLNEMQQAIDSIDNDRLSKPFKLFAIDFQKIISKSFLDYKNNLSQKFAQYDQDEQKKRVESEIALKNKQKQELDNWNKKVNNIVNKVDNQKFGLSKSILKSKFVTYSTEVNCCIERDWMIIAIFIDCLGGTKKIEKTSDGGFIIKQSKKDELTGKVNTFSWMFGKCLGEICLTRALFNGKELNKYEIAYTVHELWKNY